MSDHFVDLDHPWIRSQEFSELSASELFARVQAREKSTSGKPEAWVLDLDSTLFCVASRSRSIYVEFLRAHPQPRLEWQKALAWLNPRYQLYDIERTFREIFAQWNSQTAAELAAELWAEYRPFWEKRFFSNRHLHLDAPYAGAVEFAHAVRERGFNIVYLTGRDAPRNAPGTAASLKRAGFPFGPDTYLMMKPAREQSDLEFKLRAASVLRSRYDIRVFLDNEAENLVMAAREFPRAEIVFFHSIKSQRLPLADFRALLGERPALRLKSYSLGQQ
jgi:hypothetical protein